MINTKKTTKREKINKICKWGLHTGHVFQGSSGATRTGVRHVRGVRQHAFHDQATAFGGRRVDALAFCDGWQYSRCQCCKRQCKRLVTKPSNRRHDRRSIRGDAIAKFKLARVEVACSTMLTYQ